MKLSGVALVLYIATFVMGSSVIPPHETKVGDFHAGMHKTMAKFHPIGLVPVSRNLKKCNVNICWAFDGSDLISKADFVYQKMFSTRVVAVLGFSSTPVKVSAVQFTTIVKPILGLTNNEQQFLSKVDEMKQMKGSTKIQGGIISCRFLLDSAQGEAQHIIVMTNGAAPFGSSAAIKEAERFRSKGGLVSIVAVGNQNQNVLKKLAGSSGKVYNIKSFTHDLELVNISSELGIRVCSRD